MTMRLRVTSSATTSSSSSPLGRNPTRVVSPLTPLRPFQTSLQKTLLKIQPQVLSVRHDHILRFFSTEGKQTQNHSNSPSKEQQIRSILEQNLSPSILNVEDVSGGCGEFFSIQIESEQFVGKSLVQQHKLVKNLLSNLMKGMHGITLQTSSPKPKN
eukprot:TRINITY_DN236_c0_g2_i1.p1 TRINITY_DN236_c0_g2~~TRINITY_DN236_c0_g2_i1.p1  ORF type:complete len:173 (-),score=47.76 TRINITY_DN236_c0_g2_i1:13-483(-)